jgi:exodeoxyribonuclease V beta subunit
MYKHFDSTQTELLQGINLIEASAGTGKTYAIAMLVLRFVVEQNIGIEKILVVTFTKAATEELRDRVRRRLAEARRLLNALEYSEDTDQSIVNWLNQLDIEHDLIKQRLDMALLNIDQASIFTIHSFCQRVLREHALESGQLFDAELTDDLASIKQACTDDFWRKTFDKRTLWQASVLTANYKTPDDLLASVNWIADHLTVYPDYQDVDVALQALEQIVNVAKIALSAFASSLQAGFIDEKFNASYRSAFEDLYPLLNDWLQGRSTQIPDVKSLALLSSDGLQDGLNGHKFKTTKNQSSADRKAEYLAQLGIDTVPFEQLAAAVQQVTLVLRRSLLETLRIELDKRLQQLNVLSFDNLITRLSEALNSDKGELLASELRLRFAVALIDEFQDTDNNQWFIFSTVFGVSSHFLYLIGDPKQAIYKFRGADIFSYLGALNRADHKYTLGKNWRSHPQLVMAVNALFQRDNPFILEQLPFNSVEAGKSASNGELHWSPKQVLDSNEAPPMVLWQLAEPEQGYWSKSHAEQEIRVAVCNEIVSLLHSYRLEPNNRSVQAQDIAILVRSNQQAQDYQTALREVGVPAVLNSVESIFASHEALELLRLLNAVANPSNNSLLRQALTLNWFDLNLPSLSAIFNDENSLDDWMARFLGYYQEWQKSGLMAMMQNLLSSEKIRLKLANTIRVERQLTNIYHLIELVHQAAINEHLGINKTLDWLQTSIHKAKAQNSKSDAQQLRLESDDNAVQIVTMHRSKGLEYPIVFCPCLGQHNEHLSRESELITCHDNDKTVVDLGSANFEQHRQLAIIEEHAEDVRLFYVAVTRAKYRCYITWANVRTQNKPNESALAHLMEFADSDFSRQQARLQSFVAAQPQSFLYSLLINGQVTQGYYKKPRRTNSLQGRQRQRVLYTNWQMSSYTALSALSEHDAPELPEDKAREQAEPLIPRLSSSEELPKGAHTGNVVHDLLENHAFSDLASGKDISVLRDKACQRYSLKLDRSELLDELLENVVKTPLSESEPDFCLMNLPENQCLKEMPFYLAMQEMNAQKINTILQDSPAYQSLSSKTLCGYLTGFIDLICEYEGRYYVMDYKTNFLTEYDNAHLTLAMREHNYGLQYWLYTVVLHRYLQNRLPDYDYVRHFGGVRYLFVRGMLPDIPMSGVYQDTPDLTSINELVKLFGE